MNNNVLLQSWWMLALRGVIALAFGFAALAWPAVTLLWLVAVFAVYALVAGVIAVATALNGRGKDERWWLILLMGLVSIGAGLIALAYPEATIVALLLLIGVNALVTGMLDVILAVQLRKRIGGEWLLFASGILSALFGILVVLFPIDAGALTLVWMVSLYAILIGMICLVQAVRMRNWAHHDRPVISMPDGRA